jgi:hypothetical protein
MALSWPIAILLMDFVVDNWLTSYKGSLNIFSIFYFGSIFTAGNILGVTILVAKMQILLLIESILVVSSSIIAFILLGLHKMPICYYAWVNVAGQILVYFLILIISFYCTIKEKREKGPHRLA